MGSGLPCEQLLGRLDAGQAGTAWVADPKSCMRPFSKEQEALDVLGGVCYNDVRERDHSQEVPTPTP